jgi:hypothetical protein
MGNTIKETKIAITIIKMIKTFEIYEKVLWNGMVGQRAYAVFMLKHREVVLLT